MIIKKLHSILLYSPSVWTPLLMELLVSLLMAPVICSDVLFLQHIAIHIILHATVSATLATTKMETRVVTIVSRGLGQA